jgi:short-subunit dehydrogenase
MASTSDAPQPEKVDNKRLAVVTGASGSLGGEFARQLAAGGYHLVLTGRRKERLESLAAELRQLYGIDVDVLPADLAKIDQVRRLEDELLKLERIDLLINNAGFGLVGHFWQLDLEAQAEMLQVHDLASMRLTHAVLPGMVARRAGGVVQVSSLAAFLRRRNSVMYSATKSFLVAFSQALIDDLKGTGVRVQVLCPGFIVTEFHDPDEMKSFDRRRIPGLLWLRARDVVRESLTAIQQGSGLVIPGFWYKLSAVLLRFPGIGGILGKLAGD